MKILLTFLLLTLCNFSFAQSKATEVFEKGYVVDREVKIKKRTSDSVEEPSQLEVSKEKEKNSQQAGFKDLSAPEKIKKEKELFGGEKVERLSILLDSFSADFLKEYKDYIKHLESRNLKAGTVYVFARPDYYMHTEDYLPLSNLGGNMKKILKDIPEFLANVKTVPTWIVELQSEIVLLEGFEDVRDRFNSKGEFFRPPVKQ